jgi:hypothetical protein
MVAFAEHGDLSARWRSLSTDEQAMATVLLDDASAIVRSECAGIDARITAELVDADLVKATVCAMVKRSMLAADQAGVSSQQETIGPFSRGVQFTNPLGDLYLTRQERRRLGYGGVRAGSAPMAAATLYVEDGA